MSMKYLNGDTLLWEEEEFIPPTRPDLLKAHALRKLGYGFNRIHDIQYKVGDSTDMPLPLLPNYKIDMAKNFKKGNKVKVEGRSGKYTVLKVDIDGDVRIKEFDSYFSPDKVTLIIKKKKMNIGGYECEIKETKNDVTIYFRNYVASYTFHGDLKTFIRNNEVMIASFFADKVDIEVKGIMADFTKDFSKTLDKLKEVVLPHTKDLLLNDVIDVFKKNISEVAKLFSDVSIRNTLLNLFK